MIRYFILCLFVFASCSKQDSSSVKTDNENNLNTSSLTRERVDSLLVSNNIFQISYNEKYEIIYFSDREDSVNLRKILLKISIIDIPLKILCTNLCKGLCPVCGINLNHKPCSCSN